MTRRFSDYAKWPDLTETAVQDTIPTESYGNFGLVAIWCSAVDKGHYRRPEDSDGHLESHWWP